MSYGVLDVLITDDFDLPLTFYSTPSALRRRLAGLDEVAEIGAALRTGALTEATVRRFVEDVLGALKEGERFPHDSALAALAVVMKDRYTEFADEYLKALASLKLAEMSLSISIAKICLDQRPAKPIFVGLGPQSPPSGPVQPQVVQITPKFSADVRAENKVQQLGRTGTCS